MLEDLFEAGASAAVGEELVGSEAGVAGAVDDVEEAELHCIYDRDFEVQIPRGGRIFDFRFWIFDYGRGRATLKACLLGELVEEGVVTFVRGPDGHVVAPGDAALRRLPEEFGVGMFGEFVEADIAAVNGHGLRVGGEGDDT